MAHAFRFFRSSHGGLVVVLLALFTALAVWAPPVRDRATGQWVNGFLRPETLIQLATDTSFFAILAIGIAFVMLSGGIDLSVGSIYALSGIGTALLLKTLHAESWSAGTTLVIAPLVCLAIGSLCGFANGALVVALRVHPFVVTVGAMWILRGIAFVISQAQSINFPDSLSSATKASLGLPRGLYPIPAIAMVATAVAASLLLGRTIAGRNVYAVGGNAEAARLSGIPVRRVTLGVYVVSGLTAALAAYLGGTYYGAANSADGQGYELYAIAAAVVGGVSLQGGKGSALGAVLGALLIATIRQAITTLNLNTSYEYIIVGSALIVAVFADQWGRRHRLEDR